MKGFYPDIELTEDQEVEAAGIEDILSASSRATVHDIARLLASKSNRELFGETEFQVRDAVHRQGILAWYDSPISTGPLEGTNNKIKTMKRQAYGYRDLEFFKLKILAIHKAKYALVG